MTDPASNQHGTHKAIISRSTWQVPFRFQGLFVFFRSWARHLPLPNTSEGHLGLFQEGLPQKLVALCRPHARVLLAGQQSLGGHCRPVVLPHEATPLATEASAAHPGTDGQSLWIKPKKTIGLNHPQADVARGGKKQIPDYRSYVTNTASQRSLPPLSLSICPCFNKAAMQMCSSQKSAASKCWVLKNQRLHLQAMYEPLVHWLLSR